MSSNKEDIGILGYGITSIMTVLAFAYGNAEIKALSSFLLGSLITYVIQRRLQEDARKSTIRRENIAEIFIPLQLKFEEIQQILSDPLRGTDPSAWDPDEDILDNIFSSKQRFILTLDFRTRLYDFKSKLNKYDDDLREVQMTVSEIINAQFNSEILASGEYTNGAVFRIRANKNWRYPDFQVKKFYRGHYGNVLLAKPITLDVNPIEGTLKKNPEISLDDFEIRFVVSESVHGKNDIRIDYLMVAEAFEAYLNGVFDTIGKMDAIREIRLKNQSLTKESKEILDKLEKYIKKHYPVENSL